MRISFEGSYAVVVDEMQQFLASRDAVVEPAPKKTTAKKTTKKAAPEEAPKPTSSRRKGDGGAKADLPEEEGGITDSDLAKAASEAARLITTTEVTKILDQFAVGHMREMDQDQRREFLGLLKARGEE
jgi:hypothetical protein